jgi:twitching motility two-component system response regulator PilH
MNGIEFFKRLLGNHAPEAAHLGRTLQAASDAKMLVVDDSPTIRAVLGKMLGQEGYAVQKAVDGESAIELAKTEQPDLIFLDIVLPGINGFAVLRALRHDPLTQHIPIVMISGNQQATEQFYVQRFGADDFIKKPFGLREVQQSIHRLVHARRLPARMPAVVPTDTPSGASVSPYKSISDTVSGMAA